MYYLITILFFLLALYVLIKVMKSLVKGCFTAIILAVLVGIMFLFVQSAKNPVNLLDKLMINNYKVTRLEN